MITLTRDSRTVKSKFVTRRFRLQFAIINKVDISLELFQMACTRTHKLMIFMLIYTFSDFWYFLLERMWELLMLW